ncbi:mRNA-capping enzyme [Physcia stellaris]|nr:mRNA-capping enzyme [Physcia stellaris]
MPPSAVSSRPQTLRQARRAYQKAGATTRLSERQLKQLERSAELQERADRIKERENRRKANLKKKNERIEREREARARMGIASPVREDVGPSQMRLGAFLTVGVGVKPTCEGIQSKRDHCDDVVVEEGPPPSAQRPSPARSPLQARPVNDIIKPLAKPSPDIKPAKPSIAMPPPPRPSQQKPQSSPRTQDSAKKLTKPTARPPDKHLIKTSLDLCSSKPTLKPSTGPPRPGTMPPPPLPRVKPPLKPPNKPPPKASFQRPSKVPLKVPPNPQPITDEWAAFLVSNTQIEREICTPKAPLSSSTKKTSETLSVTKTPHLFLTQSDSDPASTPCPAGPRKLSKPSAEEVLALICTQDLLFDDEVDQELSSVDTIGKPGKHAEPKASPIEKPQPWKDEDQRKPQRQQKTDSFLDDEFDISTQEFRELVD